jgi:uracil-DNA glycosylase family 4
MTRKEKEQALHTLVEEMESAHLPLESVATQLVPGEGNPDAEIMFVGEAPGKEEDKQGRPFVGAAGKFLNELITSAGYRREDVYIGNVIKHRPPGNRDPVPEEIAAYAPWLDQQIAIILPALIVTLGRFSLAHFLGEGFSISKIHGQPKRNKKGQIIFPLYHPAAALYRGDLRPVLQADFAKLPKVLELVKNKQPVSQEDAALRQTQDIPVEQQKSLL